MTATDGSVQTRRADPAAIERELGELWRAEGEALKRAGRDDTTLARVLLLTLVVYSPSAAHADLARELTVAINPRQPARTVIMERLSDERKSDEGLDAWASLHCAASGGGRQHVCGEQITFEASSEEMAYLPGAVLPLLLTNVPSYLWWQHGLPLGQPLFEALMPAIDRLIVDSCTFEAPEAELASMVRTLDDPHFPAIISDLSWARLGTWRYQTAQIFDTPRMRPYLDRLTEVRLWHYAGTRALAWLFAGWLASRLGWQPAARSATGLSFAGGQTIEIEALPAAEPSMAGSFDGVELRADGATFAIRRASPTRTEAHLSVGEFRSERVLPLPHESLMEWLGHDLGRLTRTPIYEAALRLLASVAGR